LNKSFSEDALENLPPRVSVVQTSSAVFNAIFELALELLNVQPVQKSGAGFL
jgi:hypothetical protein